eukprot:scaffold45886_cov49-Phaeocystis_antarctica.AAC.1
MAARAPRSRAHCRAPCPHALPGGGGELPEELHQHDYLQLALEPRHLRHVHHELLRRREARLAQRVAAHAAAPLPAGLELQVLEQRAHREPLLRSRCDLAQRGGVLPPEATRRVKVAYRRRHRLVRHRRYLCEADRNVLRALGADELGAPSWRRKPGAGTGAARRTLERARAAVGEEALQTIALFAAQPRPRAKRRPD